MPKSKADTPKRGDAYGTPAAWALLAVSTEHQIETLAYQRIWAEETAKSKGWRLSRVTEGVSSGRLGPRRIVRDLLADLRALDTEARPRFLLMIRADRLGRGSVIESQIVLRDLLDLGVSVVTRDQGILKLDSAMDELISAATLAVARHENEVRSEKSLAVYRRKRAAGVRVGNRLPYGLKYEDGKVVADPERAPIVREAFKMRLAGLGYTLIGKQLRAIAPPATYQSSGSEHSISWVPSRVKTMLENRSYVPLIVDEATFAKAGRVAALLTASDRSGDARRRYPWPLAGAVRCFCGRMLIGSACGNQRRRHRYYSCRIHAHHGGHIKLFPSGEIEDQFVALLGRLRASPELVERYRRRAVAPTSPKILERSLRELKTKLAEIERRRDAAWELHIAGKVKAEDVQDRLDKLSVQRDEAQSQLAAVRDQIAVASAVAKGQQDAEALVRRAAQIFKRANVSEQNAIARAVSVELGGLHVDADGKLQVGARR
jgi:DNA invertase Pin-like site-specific DNA recombinase